MSKELDPVWKALSDPTRRSILDLLRDGPKKTSDIAGNFPNLSRFAVMKHLDVLRAANLVITEANGRERINSINVVPIRQIYERWVTPFAEIWANPLLRVKEDFEEK